jgi:carboxymethylenebutenolidase
MDKELAQHGKTYEFHSYPGAGHAFFSVDRTAYRPEAAVDGWHRVEAFFGRYLAS